MYKNCRDSRTVTISRENGSLVGQTHRIPTIQRTCNNRTIIICNMAMGTIRIGCVYIDGQMKREGIPKL